jgi:hypothetical protein
MFSSTSPSAAHRPAASSWSCSRTRSPRCVPSCAGCPALRDFAVFAHTTMLTTMPL